MKRIREQGWDAFDGSWSSLSDFFLWFCPSLWTHKNTSIWIWLIASTKNKSVLLQHLLKISGKFGWGGSFLFFITLKFFKWAVVFYRLNQSNTSKTDWNEAITTFQTVFRVCVVKSALHWESKKKNSSAAPLIAYVFLSSSLILLGRNSFYCKRWSYTNISSHCDKICDSNS